MTPVETDSAGRFGRPPHAHREVLRAAAIRHQARPRRASSYLTRALQWAIAEHGEGSLDVALLELELADVWRQMGAPRGAARLAERASAAVGTSPRHRRQTAEADAVRAMALLTGRRHASAPLDLLADACATLASVRGSRVTPRC